MSSDAPTKPPPGPPPIPSKLGRLGMGKLVVPPLKPPLAKSASPEPVSAPEHEPTKVGVAPEAGGHYSRHDSPPPGSRPPVSVPPRELAPTPESVREARREARKAVADKEAKDLQEVSAVYAVAAPARRTLDYKGIALVITALSGLGIGSWAKIDQATKDAPAAGLQAMSCQQLCPLGMKQQIPRGLPAVELQVTMTCCEVMQLRIELDEVVPVATRAREVAGEAKTQATKAEQATPKVNP
jgi:hypothetical protein